MFTSFNWRFNDIRSITFWYITLLWHSHITCRKLFYITCNQLFQLQQMPPAILSFSPQFEKALACQIIMLAPMAPHFASELWSNFCSALNRLNINEEIHWNGTVFNQKWPQLDNNCKLDLICKVFPQAFF